MDQIVRAEVKEAVRFVLNFIRNDNKGSEEMLCNKFSVDLDAYNKES